MRKSIDRLEAERCLPKEVFVQLFSNYSTEILQYSVSRANKIRSQSFGNAVYIRGLIEISSHCKNSCFYCGIRHANKKAQRYRLTKDDILACAIKGYTLGFRTFVLQGGEDSFFSAEIVAEIVKGIKQACPDCAVTLSLGEHPKEVYALWRDAGAERYLLRHETASPTHYAQLHPENLSWQNRLSCLLSLKELGYQTGTGFMVGSPGQTPECLAEDMLLLHQLQPEMVGIGPFIPHADTPFGKETAGTIDATLFCMALIRLMLPDALIPATTSLITLHPQGREKGLMAGANVLMPNLSPPAERGKYLLYNGKAATGLESAEDVRALEQHLEEIGLQLTVGRGDYGSNQQGICNVGFP